MTLSLHPLEYWCRCPSRLWNAQHHEHPTCGHGKPSWLSLSDVQKGIACCRLNVLSNWWYLSFEEDYLDQLERNQTTHSSLYDEWNADLDYVLALSLQNEHNPPNNTADEIPSGCWESYYTKESVPSSACLRERDKANIFSRDSLASFSTTNCAKSKYKHCCGGVCPLVLQREGEDSWLEMSKIAWVF